MERWLVGSQLTLNFFGDQLHQHPLRVASMAPPDAVHQVRDPTIPLSSPGDILTRPTALYVPRAPCAYIFIMSRVPCMGPHVP